MISPVQLSSYRLHEVHCSRNLEWERPDREEIVLSVLAQGLPVFEAERKDPEATPVHFELDILTSLDEVGSDGSGVPVRVVESGKTYGVTLYVGLNDSEERAAQAPVSATIVNAALVSLLSIPEREEERAAFADVVRANAAGMLYGMARDLVLHLTQSTTKVMLPSLTFRHIVEREREVEAEQA